MSNTIKQRLIVDLADDGTVVIWTTNGPVGCLDHREAAEVLAVAARKPELFAAKRATTPRTYTATETLEDFRARGGTIKQVGRRTPEPKITLTLADLGL